jgi:hypothetical protein
VSATYKALFENAFLRAAILGAFGILANILSGAFIFEITKTNSAGVTYLQWQSFTHCRSFWCLISVLALMGFYGWGMARSDAKAQESAQAAAEFASEALRRLHGPMIEKAEADIREGKLKTMEEVRQMFLIKTGGIS